MVVCSDTLIMKSFWNYLKLKNPIWLFASLVITLVSILFISLADANNILAEDGAVLFGFKAFNLFAVVMMWVWVMIVYQNRPKQK